MASSYEKICESFTKSQQWKNLNDEFRQDLTAFSITKYEFKERSYEEDPDKKVEPYFVLTLGKDSCKKSPAFFADDLFNFPASDLIRTTVLDEIPDYLFGSEGFPTYFCKKDKLLEGSKKITKWADFARLRLMSENKDLVAESAARVKLQQQTIIQSPEFIHDKKRFYDLIVINEIKSVVLKYYEKVGPDVLKEALDSVVTHAIMESAFLLVLLKTFFCVTMA